MIKVNELMATATVIALEQARKLGLEDAGLLEDWKELTGSSQIKQGETK